MLCTGLSQEVSDNRREPIAPTSFEGVYCANMWILAQSQGRTLGSDAKPHTFHVPVGAVPG